MKTSKVATFPIFLVFALLPMLLSCGSTPDRIQPERLKSPTGAEWNLIKDKVILGKVPNIGEVETLVYDKGVTLLIDLRSEKVRKGAPVMCKLKGARCVEHSLLAGGDISRKQVDMIEVELKGQPKGGKIFVFAETLNLPAAWLASHFVLAHKMRPSDALILAESSGLADIALKRKTESFLYINKP